jgi:phosphotransferase system IIB component
MFRRHVERQNTSGGVAVVMKNGGNVQVTMNVQAEAPRDTLDVVASTDVFTTPW